MIDKSKKYRTRKGWDVEIFKTDLKERDYPVFGVVYRDEFEDVITWNKDGYEVSSDNPSDYDLVEVGPWDDFKCDEPVMVKDRDDDGWSKRHFAGAENGVAICWGNGGTSWTTEITTRWNECRRPTEEELKK